MVVDIAVVAGVVVSKFLAPYVKLGAERLADEVSERFSDSAAEHVSELSESLWTRVKGLFSSEKEQTTLELFEQDPEGLEASVERILREKLDANPALAEELAGLVDSPSPDGSGTGAQIMSATIAGIFDARGATIHGGKQAGVLIEGGAAQVDALVEGPRRPGSGGNAERT
jgi:hypothetical protein